MGYLGSILGLGRSPGERKGYPLQYSGLENSMDCIVHGVAKSWTQLSNFQRERDINVRFRRSPIVSNVPFYTISELPWWLSWQRIRLQCRRPWFNYWVGKILWRRDRLPSPVFLDFPCGSAGKESACNAGDLGSIPGLGRSPGERKGYPLQYSGLENSMDCIVHGVAKSQTWLSDFHSLTLSLNNLFSFPCFWTSYRWGYPLCSLWWLTFKSTL